MVVVEYGDPILHGSESIPQRTFTCLGTLYVIGRSEPRNQGRVEVTVTSQAFLSKVLSITSYDYKIKDTKIVFLRTSLIT